MSYAPPQPKKKASPPSQANSDPFASLQADIDAMMGKAQQPKVPQPKVPQPTLEQIRQQQEQQAAALKKKAELDAAKQLLQQHFDVDDTHANNANRLGNQVTKAEFEEHAELLANIARGDTSLKFAQAGKVPTQEEADNKQGTLKDLAKVMSTKTGRTVIGDLSKRFNKTTFAPNPNNLSNSAGADDWDAAADIFGGSDATIRFRPGFNKTKAMTGLPVDITSDTSLLHEMVHAHHLTSGMMMKGQYEAADLGLGHKDIGVRKEEYATVGLGHFANNALTENAYRAEMEAIHATNPNEKAKYAKRTSYNK